MVGFATAYAQMHLALIWARLGDLLVSNDR